MNINLDFFTREPIANAATALFRQLGIALTPKFDELVSNPNWPKRCLGESYKDCRPYTDIEALFLGIVSDPALDFAATDSGDTYKNDAVRSIKNYSGLLVFTAQLTNAPNRSQIAELTRAFNREFKENPVGLVLKYGDKISIAISERSAYRQDWREGEKVGKVIILRDINVEKPHAGHLRILDDLKNHNAANYNELYEHWLKTLNIDILNKKFFTEISNWYFWASQHVKFPDDVEKDEDIRNSTNLIRLITRIIFIWFIKEKGLVPEKLFDEKELGTILKDFNKKGNYYNAILQNLFFGTLNQKIGVRDFISEKHYQGKNKHYNITTFYRYPELFNISKEKAKELFSEIPFLNGGLFDCLDKPNEHDHTQIFRIDGFSTKEHKRAIVHDFLFFGNEQSVDLNAVYNTKNKTYKSKGLVKILNSYKFTIAENTPQEEDVALDPELLGRVFENLLASYNPETKETARKQSGSFYTPREIVNYMVNESLTAYLREKVGEDWENNKQTINAINEIKILDPACGSGAFPMGILHKMVEILQKLDPENEDWQRLQEEKATVEFKDAIKIEIQQERDKRLMEISDIFEHNNTDYGRKLFLIENCIFGVDIQPIAVQISKLRFFLSLVIEQAPTKDANDNYGIKPLPNLETKFVAANTLIGLEKEGTIFRTAEMIAKENELKQVRHEYFTASDRKKKLSLQEKDKKLRGELAKMLKGLGFTANAADQIARFDPYDQNTSAGWFDAEWMFGLSKESGQLKCLPTKENDRLNYATADGDTGAEVGGYFDVVIGNPPYVSAPTMVNTNIEGRKAIIDSMRFTTLYQKWDMYVPFMELSLQLLTPMGIFTMIVPYPLTNQTYAKKLRELIISQYNLMEIVDLNGTKVFENATVSNCIPFIGRLQSTGVCYISKINEQKQIIKTFIQKYSDLVQDEKNCVWNLAQEKRETCRHSEMNVLGDFCYISVGMVLNADEKTARGDFTKDELISETLDAIHCRKYIEAKDIERYFVKRVRYLEYNTKRCPDQLRRPTFRELYEKPKLMFNRLGNLMVYYDEKTKYLHSDSMFSGVLWKDLKGIENKSISASVTRYSRFSRKVMEAYSKQIDLRYLLGILNSKYASVLLSNLRGGDYHIYPEHLRNLPIPLVDKNMQKPIIYLVDKILIAKKKTTATDTSELERQIDKLVYVLYDLTEAEIAIIEKN